jgi:hypothetical protein
MPAITKFIIALDPAAPCYALSFDVSPCDIFRNTAATRAVATPDRTKAHQFDTYEAAADVRRDITGWGGAQRVETIEVEVKRPSLNDPATRIEARDIATNAWYEWAEIGETDGPSCNRTEAARLAHVAGALRAEGYRVGVDIRNGASSFVTLNLCDPFGVCWTLDWEPSVDGFDYPTSGDDACDIAEEKAQHEDEPETAFCDGCEGCFPVDDVEVCGDADHGSFGFCKTCRAKDEQAPRHFRDEPICAGCDGLFPLREGQDECETCAAARSIVNPVTAALVAATEELSDWIDMADAEAKAERQPVMPILDEDAVIDLLTNLRHATLYHYGIDFDELVAISARHFVAEVKVRADIARKRAEQANG